MRKLFFAFSMLILSQISFGQAVQDNATIPVSMTLNSILRLTVTTGGNIQFVFNTMDQYNNGIPNSLGTTTTFTVASTRAFTVNMGAEDATFIGVEDAANTLLLNVMEYNMVASTGLGAKAAGWNPLLQDVALTPDLIVTAGVAGGAIGTRTYTVQWRAGVTNDVLNNPPDVYVTNVFLNLQPI